MGRFAESLYSGKQKTWQFVHVMVLMFISILLKQLVNKNQLLLEGEMQTVRCHYCLVTHYMTQTVAAD